MAKKAQDDPLWWMRKCLGVKPWDIQRQIVESVRDNERTAVVACHAIGKSWVTSAIAIHFLHAYPGACVLLTAPTYRQIKEVLWREITSMKEMAPQRLLGKVYANPIWEITKKFKWFMLGFSPQHPEKAQGFHAPYVLVIIDEASGVSDGVLEALRGVMASGTVVRLLILGNPNKPEGELFRAFNGNRGGYNAFQVSAWDTPNLSELKDLIWGERGEAMTGPERCAILEAAPLVHPKLVNAKFVAKMEREFGIDSDPYRVRVLGQFPVGGDNQLIPYHQVIEAADRWENLGWDGKHERFDPTARWWLHRHMHGGQVIGALDVARFGSNESIWCSRLDTVASPLHCFGKLDNVDLANQAAEKYREQQCSMAVVDEDGMSGGFDVLKRLVPNVVGFRGGLAATDPEHYGNKRSEGYHGLAERYREGRIAHERDELLIGQMTGIRYKYRTSGQRMIESKDDMVARGVKSPDRADAMMMCYDARPMILPPVGQTKLTDWGPGWR